MSLLSFCYYFPRKLKPWSQFKCSMSKYIRKEPRGDSPTYTDLSLSYTGRSSASFTTSNSDANPLAKGTLLVQATQHKSLMQQDCFFDSRIFNIGSFSNFYLM